MPELTIYTEDELKAIHQLELDALGDIIRICDKLDINYFLIDGAALGAMRHNGFIPWDDDIDIGMTREDYRRFLEEAPALLPEKYFLQTPYQGNKNPYFYTKLRINGTEFAEFCNRKLDIHHGVYVDICPYDEVPDDERLNKKQFRRCRFLIRLFVLRQSPEMSTEPTSPKRKILASVRFVLHYAVRLIPYRWMALAIERETTRYNGTGQSAYAFLHHPKWKTDYMLKSELFPLKKQEFNGALVNVPGDCDAYLRRHYGDYTIWPEPEMRYGHKPYRIKLNNDVFCHGEANEA